MAKLIYHPVGTQEQSVSPFDAAIVEMAASQQIKIACPYLGREPLSRLTKHCAGWQLLTDLKEVLQPHSPQRKWFIQFFREHKAQVRHCEGLHAKVIATKDQAIIGSANLTYSGLARRHEMSVQLSDQESLRQLHQWFDKLWEGCCAVDESALLKFADALPKTPPQEPDVPVLDMPPGPRVNATLASVSKMRQGRWTEDAYRGIVAEKWPHFLTRHGELLDRLKAMNAARFSGNGPVEPTYHAVVPGTEIDILWVYAHGDIYARWGQLNREAAAIYKRLWGESIEPTRKDGVEKTDGSFLQQNITEVDFDDIAENIERLRDALNSR